MAATHYRIVPGGAPAGGRLPRPVLDPDLVLADEPTGNLDPANKQAVLDQLIQLCKRHGRILLTVTHDHSLLPSFDRVVDMATLLTAEVDAA